MTGPSAGSIATIQTLYGEAEFKKMRFGLRLSLVVLLLSYQMLYHVICHVTERQTGAVILGVSTQQIHDMLRSVSRLLFCVQAYCVNINTIKK